LTQRGLEREPVAAWEKAFLAVLLVLALALRLIALDSGLWFDEIDTLLHQARQPLAHTLTTYDSRNNHYLFSILAKLSVSIFGDHAFRRRCSGSAAYGPCGGSPAASPAGAWRSWRRLS
jgi:hypothetical protein